MAVFSNAAAAGKLFLGKVKRDIQRGARGALNRIMANKTIGPPVTEAVLQSHFALHGVGGLRGALRGIRGAIAEAAAAGGYSDDAARLFNMSMDALTLGTVGAATRGVRAWFSPSAGGRRNWESWFKRMGMTAGAAFGIGTVARWMSGTGGMFHSEGEFDIAGIPFI